MSKFFSGKEIVTKLTKMGFIVVSQKGSHVKLRGIVNTQTRTVIVPMHKEIARGTFRSILSQAGITLEDFNRIK